MVVKSVPREKINVADLDVAGRRVLLRVDFNVPLEKGRVADDTRIRAALPTIKLLLERGTRVVILASHLGRPKGKVVPALRLDPVADRLEALLNRPVRKLDQVVGAAVRCAVEEAAPGSILLLENIRFEPGEETNGTVLAQKLAELADLYVNDAFGAVHRAHASTVGVAALLPAAAGLLVAKEIDVLQGLREHSGRPLTVIMGGAKVSDKIAVIRRFLNTAEKLLIGGGMANTFLAAQGYNLGDSLVEPGMLDAARNLFAQSAKSCCRLLLPTDLIIAARLEPNSSTRVVVPGAVPAGWKAVDIGPETATTFAREVVTAVLLFWNGPLGVFEVPPFDRGTALVARAITGSKAFSVAGGGDMVAALEKLGLADRFSFISTGGGATLEFLEGKELPGLTALRDRSRC